MKKIFLLKDLLISIDIVLQGVCLTRVPKIKLVVIIGGAKFRKQSVVEKAYSSPIQCPSVHFLGNSV